MTGTCSGRLARVYGQTANVHARLADRTDSKLTPSYDLANRMSQAALSASGINAQHAVDLTYEAAEVAGNFEPVG